MAGADLTEGATSIENDARMRSARQGWITVKVSERFDIVSAGAVDGLIRIGTPAVPALIPELEQDSAAVEAPVEVARVLQSLQSGF